MYFDGSDRINLASLIFGQVIDQNGPKISIVPSIGKRLLAVNQPFLSNRAEWLLGRLFGSTVISKTCFQ